MLAHPVPPPRPHGRGGGLYPLIQRKDDGAFAIDELARLGCCLLEMGVEALGEVPYIDCTELQASVLAVMAAVNERLRQPPTPPAESQQTTRVLRLRGLTLTVTTERPASDEPEQQ